MMRLRLQFLPAVILFFSMSCGGAGEIADSSVADGLTDSAETDGDAVDDTETFDAGEDDAASGTLAAVKYVTLENPDLSPALLGRFAVNADDADGATEPGCKSIEYNYDAKQPRTYCFARPSKSDALHYMILRDAQGKELLQLYAGTHCRTIDVKPGHYTMDICHEGGSDAAPSATIFIANTDISASTELDEASDTEEGDGSTYDYEEDDEESASPLFANPGQEAVFLATNTCVRCDLTGSDFTGVDFTLIGAGIATLSGSNLTGADFTGANLTGATMNKVRLDDAILTNAVLTNANLTSSSMMRADFNAAVLTGVNLTRARLDDADLTGATLAASILTRARFNRAILNGANLNAAAMTYTVVEGADLTNAVMTGAINMSYLKAGGADFTNVSFTNGNLSNAFFNGAIMTNVTLAGCNLLRTRFNNVDLSTADMLGATNSTTAIWKNAILTGASWADGTACSAPPAVSMYDPSVSRCN